MGETGPCGPCSEIHIDREPNGAHPVNLAGAACDQTAHRGVPCGVNVDGCSRFIELGNLVFIQYNRDAAGKLTPLPMKHVDTGTGLERVAAVLQSLETGRYLGNYDIDLFQKIIASIQDQTRPRKRYGLDNDDDISFRAIADHARAITFLIADGVRPGNSDRSYVLRRLIRRAARHGRKLRIGIHGFLSSVCGAVVEAMGDAYVDLLSKEAEIKDVVSTEEQRFHLTLVTGLEFLRSEIRIIRNQRYRL